MSTFEQLLGVQELDTTIDQLLHRRATLPELSELAQLERDAAAAAAAVSETTARLDVVRDDERAAEEHASQLETKAAEIDRSLYDGSVTSHKELESLQEEHAALKVRQAQFEEQAIELMELAEPIEAELQQRTDRVETIAADIVAVQQRIAVAQAEIDVSVDETRAQRADAAAGVSPELLSSYEELRGQLGGIAVARLHGARCEGCHLEIPSAQLAALRRAPEAEVVTCPECFRILVR
ncbi:MAG: C4-type zinc ribbon domain-containing protein [Actinomycetota bacterium]|nr:C4-type zinc ribbon domain-containing protein [Actinomycetota bacterium]